MNFVTASRCSPRTATGNHHHWWFVFPLFWVTAIALFSFFVGRRRWRRDPLDSARQRFAERYARDELSADDYRKRWTSSAASG